MAPEQNYPTDKEFTDEFLNNMGFNERSDLDSLDLTELKASLEGELIETPEDFTIEGDPVDDILEHAKTREQRFMLLECLLRDGHEVQTSILGKLVTIRTLEEPEGPENPPAGDREPRNPVPSAPSGSLPFEEHEAI